ncbi:MAG TPA: hypothetical protein VF179_25725 [Thermoanaerobaculia bacterium]|nr:hypothetical protein [Thermoanaerobaculia bacterium]
MQLNSIRDTTLWKRLKNSFSGYEGELAQTLALNLVSVCQEAYDRMKAFPSLHPEYTLHDEVHLLRVTELMSRILPKEVLDQLNPAEILLLILAAHFHDQGMVLEQPEISVLAGETQFTLFRDNWIISHPNLKEIEQALQERTLSEAEKVRFREIEQELKAALLTDYVRQTHGGRSASFVRATYAKDPRWEIGGTNVAELVARLCLSHVIPSLDLDGAHGFRYDEVVSSYRVNMVYLGLILRLADILDLDRDRTPDTLYRSIHFKSSVSLREWAKHRSVEGWLIQPDFIQFTMRCEHPEYQRAAYHFMDSIDHELADAQAACRAFPASVDRYRLDLPLSVDRSRIEPKDDGYIYSDLEFSLSRDEIIKLLMADKLYGQSWICVRELLQNALDALRTHRAVIRRDVGVDWLDGKIEMIHELDSDGYEILKCTDNGIGMDRNVVERFLTRAGRSYYRSPEFEMERVGFRALGFDFDPCAQYVLFYAG